MRTRRPLLAGIPFVNAYLFLLPSSFPDSWDNCGYRNITLYAYGMAPVRPTAGPPCTVPLRRVRVPCRHVNPIPPATARGREPS